MIHILCGILTHKKYVITSGDGALQKEGHYTEAQKFRTYVSFFFPSRRSINGKRMCPLTILNNGTIFINISIS